MASPSQADHSARRSAGPFRNFHYCSGIFLFRSHRFLWELAAAARSRPHLDHHAISDECDRSAVLPAVGHESIDAALVSTGEAKAIAVSPICAFKRGIAPRITVLSHSRRTAYPAQCTTLDLGCGLRCVFGLLLFQRPKRGAFGRPHRAATESYSRLAVAWNPDWLAASAAMDRLGGVCVCTVARNNEPRLPGHRRKPVSIGFATEFVPAFVHRVF